MLCNTGRNNLLDKKMPPEDLHVKTFVKLSPRVHLECADGCALHDQR